MMHSNSTHKVVVGIGLAVVFGVGVSVFTVRAKHESELARNAPALAAPSDQSDQNGTGAAVPNAAAQTPTDQTAPTPPAPTVTVPPPAPSAAPATAAPASPPTTSNSTKDGTDRHVARTRNSSGSSSIRVASAASASNSVTPAPTSSDMTASVPAGAPADATQAAAQTGQETATGAGPAATSSEPVASDSQITTAVKSEIASATPGSTVDVTTTNGLVVLAGSVPSQDNVDEARQAAQRVPGVKHVDASGLTVSNH
jgi:hyperosmotically inducible protein